MHVRLCHEYGDTLIVIGTTITKTNPVDLEKQSIVKSANLGTQGPTYKCLTILGITTVNKIIEAACQESSLYPYCV